MLKSLLHPADRIAWLSILRAPWCGLSLADLLVVAGHQHQDTPIWQRLLTLTHQWEDSASDEVHADEIHAEDMLNSTAPLINNDSLVDNHSFERSEDSARHSLDYSLDQYPNRSPDLSLNLSPDGLQRLERLVMCLKPALEQKGRKPIAQWLKGVWMALGGNSYLDEHEKKDVNVFFQLLEQQKQPGHLLSIQDFEEAVSRLYAEPDQNADPRLIIMTIHKSKGLEFENVILPGLDLGTQSDTDSLLLWQQRLSMTGEQQLLLSPIAASDQSNNDPIYDFLKSEKQKKVQLETTRLLYVGATRAINRLHLMVSSEYDESTKEWKSPSSQSLIAPLWNACLQQGKTLFTDKTLDNTRELKLALFQIQRLPSDWQPPKIKTGELLTDYRGIVDDITVEEEYEPSAQSNSPALLSDDSGMTVDVLPINELHDATSLEQLNIPSFEQDNKERHIGIVVHKILEYLVNHSNIHAYTENQEDFIQQYQTLWLHWLKASGLNNSQSHQALPHVIHAIKGLLNDDIGLWILNSKHEASASELAITWSRHKSTRHFIVDRTFIDQDVRWIIDYKITKPKKDQNFDAFLQENEALYREQLDNYRRYFLQIEKHPIKTALYFPLIPYLYEIKM